MIEAPDFDDPSYKSAQKLFEEIKSLIGAVVTSWASLDNELIRLWSALAHCPVYATGIMFYSLNAISNQTAIIKGLVTHNVDEVDLKKECLEILEKLRSLSATRNEFVHSVYGLRYNSSGKRSKWTVGKDTFRSERLQIASRNKAQKGELNDHLKSVGLLSHALRNVADKMAARKSSPSRRIQVQQRQQTAQLTQDKIPNSEKSPSRQPDASRQ